MVIKLIIFWIFPG